MKLYTYLGKLITEQGLDYVVVNWELRGETKISVLQLQVDGTINKKIKNQIITALSVENIEEIK